MAQTWYRKQGDNEAHLIKFFGPAFYTAACQVIIPRNMAVYVRLIRVGLNYWPYYCYRPDADVVCAKCQSKAE